MTGRKIISLATFGAAAMAISCANPRRKVKAIFNDRGGSSSRVPVCQCNSVTVYHPPVVTLQLMQILHQIVTNYECHGQPRPLTPTQQLTGVWSHCTHVQCPPPRIRTQKYANIRLFVMWWSCWIFAAWPSCVVSSCPNKTPRCHQALTQYQYSIFNIVYCIITLQY